ncbi:MAG: hypothetical protein ACTS73_01590 [Arsenophonus sp. NEOnobi-MAG3]
MILRLKSLSQRNHSSNEICFNSSLLLPYLKPAKNLKKFLP